jgi:hypothetical protein
LCISSKKKEGVAFFNWEADCGPLILCWAGRRAERASHIVFFSVHFKLTIFIILLNTILGADPIVRLFFVRLAFIPSLTLGAGRGMVSRTRNYSSSCCAAEMK